MLRTTSKTQQEALEKQVSKMRQEQLLKGSSGEKKTLALKV